MLSRNRRSLARVQLSYSYLINKKHSDAYHHLIAQGQSSVGSEGGNLPRSCQSRRPIYTFLREQFARIHDVRGTSADMMPLSVVEDPWEKKTIPPPKMREMPKKVRWLPREKDEFGHRISYDEYRGRIGYYPRYLMVTDFEAALDDPNDKRFVRPPKPKVDDNPWRLRNFFGAEPKGPSYSKISKDAISDYEELACIDNWKIITDASMGGTSEGHLSYGVATNPITGKPMKTLIFQGRIGRLLVSEAQVERESTYLPRKTGWTVLKEAFTREFGEKQLGTIHPEIDTITSSQTLLKGKTGSSARVESPLEKQRRTLLSRNDSDSDSTPLLQDLSRTTTRETEGIEVAIDMPTSSISEQQTVPTHDQPVFSTDSPPTSSITTSNSDISSKQSLSTSLTDNPNDVGREGNGQKTHEEDLSTSSSMSSPSTPASSTTTDSTSVASFKDHDGIMELDSSANKLGELLGTERLHDVNGFAGITSPIFEGGLMTSRWNNYNICMRTDGGPWMVTMKQAYSDDQELFVAAVPPNDDGKYTYPRTTRPSNFNFQKMRNFFLPFKDFLGTRQGQVRKDTDMTGYPIESFGLSIRGPPGPFRIEIGWIAFHDDTEPSLSDVVNERAKYETMALRSPLDPLFGSVMEAESFVSIYPDLLEADIRKEWQGMKTRFQREPYMMADKKDQNAYIRMMNEFDKINEVRRQRMEDEKQRLKEEEETRRSMIEAGANPTKANSAEEFQKQEGEDNVIVNGREDEHTITEEMLEPVKRDDGILRTEYDHPIIVPWTTVAPIPQPVMFDFQASLNYQANWISTRQSSFEVALAEAQMAAREKHKTYAIRLMLDEPVLEAAARHRHIVEARQQQLEAQKQAERLKEEQMKAAQKDTPVVEGGAKTQQTTGLQRIFKEPPKPPISGVWELPEMENRTKGEQLVVELKRRGLSNEEIYKATVSEYEKVLSAPPPTIKEWISTTWKRFTTKKEQQRTWRDMLKDGIPRLIPTLPGVEPKINEEDRSKLEALQQGNVQYEIDPATQARIDAARQEVERINEEIERTNKLKSGRPRHSQKNAIIRGGNIIAPTLASGKDEPEFYGENMSDGEIVPPRATPAERAALQAMLREHQREVSKQVSFLNNEPIKEEVEVYQDNEVDTAGSSQEKETPNSNGGKHN